MTSSAEEQVARSLSNLLVQMRQLEPLVPKLAKLNNNLVEWNGFFAQLLTATAMQKSRCARFSVAGKENGSNNGQGAGAGSNLSAIPESPRSQDCMQTDGGFVPATQVRHSLSQLSVKVVVQICVSSRRAFPQ